MFRAGSQKRTTSPDQSGENYRRDCSHHISHGLRDIPDFLLYPLQRLFLDKLPRDFGYTQTTNNIGATRIIFASPNPALM